MIQSTLVLPMSSSSATTQDAPTIQTATGNNGGGTLPPILILTPLSPEPERRKRPALADIAITLSTEFSGYRLEEEGGAW